MNRTIAHHGRLWNAVEHRPSRDTLRHAMTATSETAYGEVVQLTGQLFAVAGEDGVVWIWELDRLLSDMP